MTYEKWEDVPEWLQEIISGQVASAYYQEEAIVTLATHRGRQERIPIDLYTSAVHLYEQRTLNMVTPEEWDIVGKPYYSEPTNINNSNVKVGSANIGQTQVTVGETWFLKYPNNNSLSKVEVTLVTPCVVGLKEVGLPRDNYWARKDIEFVEKVG
jgi:hypothetical protein